MARGDDVVVGTVASPVARSWDAACEDFVAGDPGRSVLLRGPDRDVTAGRAEDVPRPGASVLKLLVAVAAVEADRDGTFDLSAGTPVRALPRSRYPTFADVFDPDRSLTGRELIGVMLATGDNRVADHLVTTVGPDRINAVGRALGCTATEVRVGFGDDVLNHRGRANTTTTRDAAVLLEIVRHRADLAFVVAAMATNLSNTRIPLRLPDEVVVAHKTGTLAGVVNDVGLVRAPHGDIVACFLTDGQADHAATSAAIGACVRQAFDAWEGDPTC